MVVRYLLLHELGHVFGVGHYRETVMTSDIVGLLKACEADDCLANLEGKIDLRSQLVNSDMISQAFVGKISNHDLLARIFGIKSAEGVNGLFTKNPDTWDYSITAKGPHGDVPVKIDFPGRFPEDIIPRDSSKAFHVIRKYGGMNFGGGHESNFKVTLARLKTVAQEELSAVIEWNGGKENIYPVRIRVLEHGIPLELFSGTYAEN
jgi:hypothetical protein